MLVCNIGNNASLNLHSFTLLVCNSNGIDEAISYHLLNENMWKWTIFDNREKLFLTRVLSRERTQNVKTVLKRS